MSGRTQNGGEIIIIKSKSFVLICDLIAGAIGQEYS